MKRALVLGLLFAASLAHADGEPDPKRKVAVLEYRSGSSALVGIGTKIATEIGKLTSLTVLGPAQAKTVYGDQLDQAVVKCGGEADCIAKIGTKLGVTEVILVGVSELGDVILTVQRIDIKTKAIQGRIADSIASDAPPTAEQVEHYVARLLPPTDFLRYGIVDIVANEPGALVTIGGEQRGTTPIAPLKLKAPASYVIKIEKRGFVPFTTTVQLPPDGELKVEAELSRRTKAGGSPWYKSWWFVGSVGLVAAGATGATIYYVTRNDSLGFKGTVE